jgi:hypothetical protein
MLGSLSQYIEFGMGENITAEAIHEVWKIDTAQAQRYLGHTTVNRNASLRERSRQNFVHLTGLYEQMRGWDTGFLEKQFSWTM